MWISFTLEKPKLIIYHLNNVTVFTLARVDRCEHRSLVTKYKWSVILRSHITSSIWLSIRLIWTWRTKSVLSWLNYSSAVGAHGIRVMNFIVDILLRKNPTTQPVWGFCSGWGRQEVLHRKHHQGAQRLYLLKRTVRWFRGKSLLLFLIFLVFLMPHRAYQCVEFLHSWVLVTILCGRF